MLVWTSALKVSLDYCSKGEKTQVLASDAVVTAKSHLKNLLVQEASGFLGFRGGGPGSGFAGRSALFFGGGGGKGSSTSTG